jgi:myo-inositol-1(or 4)-monophosphatase
LVKKVNWTQVLRKAGAAGRGAILRNYSESSRHKILGKGVGGDMTLRIDRVSENAVFSSLKKDLGSSPFVFLSEEIGEVSKLIDAGSPPVVVCDPLDGSHNAEIGIPLFCVALSVIEPDDRKGRTFENVTNSLITSIKTDDEFVGVKGGGSFHNRRRMKLRKRDSSYLLNTLLVETSNLEYLRQNILSQLTKEEVNKTRLLGSAALSYCMLAEGAADGFVFAQNGGSRTIDSPAGYLIAKEAGAEFFNVTQGSEVPIEDVEVGFSSKVNIVGARNREILAILAKKLASLP